MTSTGAALAGLLLPPIGSHWAIIMSQTTSIEWCDSTFNPWIGCTRISPACDDCYAARSTPARALDVAWGPKEERRRTSPANWALPRRWNANAAEFQAEHGRRRRVFCASLADVFDNQVPQEWRDDLWRLISETPQLDWLLLTKRVGNVTSMLPVSSDFADLFPHVWIGATICNQDEADRDIPKLQAVPARVRFLSMEPLLGPVDLLATGDVLCRCSGCLSMASLYPESAGLQRIDWVIVGGESGPRARPMSPTWVRHIRDQCLSARVPFLYKQWGEWVPTEALLEGFSIRPDKQTTLEGWTMVRAGKKAAGRHLDRVEHNGFPCVSTT